MGLLILMKLPLTSYELTNDSSRVTAVLWKWKGGEEEEEEDDDDKTSCNIMSQMIGLVHLYSGSPFASIARFEDVVALQRSALCFTTREA